MPEKITPGVVIISKFVQPDDKKFAKYIDYIDRDEAVRNRAYQDYSAYMDDYMDNPEKRKEAYGFNPDSQRTTELFTANSDTLCLKEKRALKKQFVTAQKNGSLMWQNVISFDSDWLEKYGILDRKNGYIDEARVKLATRRAMEAMLKSERMEASGLWSADVHYNTDNIHVHIAVVEPVPMREKIVRNGEEVYKGRLKQETFRKMKSEVVNNLVDRCADLTKINNLVRNTIIGDKKARPSYLDPNLRRQFLQIYQSMPADKYQWNYAMDTMKALRPRLDAFSRAFIQQYRPEDYKQLLQELDKLDAYYPSAYGVPKNQKQTGYKENKLEDLYKRLGNTVIKEMRTYDAQLQQTHGNQVAKKLQSAAAVNASLRKLHQAAATALKKERAQNRQEYQQLLKQLNRTGRDHGREVNKGESYEEEL